MSAPPTADEQMRRIAERTAEVFPAEEMKRKVERSVASKRPLRVKLGVDPTAPDVTLGNAVPLWKLRTFQELGHVAVLIIGDYTAQVGDPSGRNALRPMLTKEQVEAYAKTYLDQVGKILLPERLEIRRNSEWLAPLTFMDVLKLLGRMTVSQMLERDDFHKRFEEESPISLHEFLYPLMQGWDSVVVKADVELGGTDQRFNLLVGRDLQRAEGQEAQALVINPLVAGTDGAKKMSKSAGNYVGVTETPNEMFGKSMSIPDALMKDWMTFFTDLAAARVAELCDPAKTHPRQAKEEMAKGIIRRYHGSAAADAAAEEFRRVFSQREVPAEMAEVRVPAGPSTVAALVALCVPDRSKGELRRLVEQGAVTLDGAKLADAKASVDPKDGAVLKVGKLTFVRIRRS
jgi:tyrosyl-tRNA synthetase